MSIVWGGFNSYMRLGIEVWTDSYNTWTPSINVYVRVHAQCASNWNFNDGQTVTLSGSRSGSWNWQNTLGPNQIYTFPTVTIAGQGQSFGGGPVYSFSAVLTGNYLGGQASVSRTFTLPARPTRAPAPPSWGPVIENNTATGFHASWGGSPDHGGLSPTSVDLMVAADPGYTQLAHFSSPLNYSRRVEGIAPNYNYYIRARIVNPAGYSDWTPTVRGATVPFNPGTPSFSQVRPDAADVSWGAPSGGSVSQYQVQYSKSSSFSSPTQLNTTNSSASLSGLDADSTYYVRVRAATVNGHYGAWSETGVLQTLSGARVRVGSQWEDAVPWVRKNGVWVKSNVKKRIDGAWV